MKKLNKKGMLYDWLHLYDLDCGPLFLAFTFTCLHGHICPVLSFLFPRAVAPQTLYTKHSLVKKLKHLTKNLSHCWTRGPCESLNTARPNKDVCKLKYTGLHYYSEMLLLWTHNFVTSLWEYLLLKFLQPLHSNVLVWLIHILLLFREKWHS